MSPDASVGPSTRLMAFLGVVGDMSGRLGPRCSYTDANHALGCLVDEAFDGRPRGVNNA